ncbi:MAG: spore germination protein [Lachnospirales bacterium]
MSEYNNYVKYIDSKFENWGDIVKREIKIGSDFKTLAYIVYIDDMVNRDLIENQIIKNFMIYLKIPNNSINNYLDNGITTADIKFPKNIDDAILEVMSGNTLILIDGYDKFIVISSKGFPKRGVDKPETEIVIQGPQEAFSESLRINTVLIRRRIRDTNLKCKQIKIGNVSNTDVAIMYMENKVDKNVLKEAMKRLNKINTDIILDSGYLEQFIEDNTLSPFPQIQLTERPDKAAAEICEGRIAIIVDNSPYIMLIPTVLASFYQSAEDYYERWEIMSVLRIVRYIAGFAAFTLPGLYIAILLYSPELIPTSLTLKLASDRLTVPFPTIVEVIGMEIIFEALREAGIRMPNALGGTLGIVGGIIIGQAAVDAGLVSPMVVIIIALTGVCSFAIPNVALVSAYRLLKYFIIFISAIFGMIGFIVGIFIVLTHICSIKSFGVNYSEPFSGDKDDSVIDDTFLRVPLKYINSTKIFNKKED